MRRQLLQSGCLRKSVAPIRRGTETSRFAQGHPRPRCKRWGCELTTKILASPSYGMVRFLSQAMGLATVCLDPKEIFRRCRVRPHRMRISTNYPEHRFSEYPSAWRTNAATTNFDDAA